MKLITVSGPPSSGKTSMILRLLASWRQEEGVKAGVVKFDCLSNNDCNLYEKQRIPVRVGLSANLCPDHFYISNVADAMEWAKEERLDLLITESAGLCNRCSPHIRRIPAVCVIDNLSGSYTPQKIGPMLKFADIVVVTKGDIVSQAEREVFAYHVRMINPKTVLIFVNGITGQGIFPLLHHLQKKMIEVDTLEQLQLRFTMPTAICSYCTGQTRIGEAFQMGNIRKMEF